MDILITGANRGIGLELARRLAGRGDRVIATTRARGPEAVGAEAGAPDVEWKTLDVRDAASHRALSEDLGARPLDLVVCNAGVYLEKGRDRGEDLTPEMWQTTFATNVTGVFLTVQALLPALTRAGAGKIAIIASAMGSQSRASGGSWIYRASKAAAINLGRNMAVDLAPRGIAVGIYHPGWVRTGMGGPEAPVRPGDSAAGLIERFDALSMATTGCFESYDGATVAF